MSKVKHPREKEDLSLERDRRNTYGENPQASRKGIREGKQRSHMKERRSAAQLLGQLNGQIDDDAASDTELRVKVAISDSRNRGFRKIPDEPLGVVIEQKRAWRSKLKKPKA
jgi:hypothetical protein